MSSSLCPLCQFNLEMNQDKIVKKYKEDVKLPILYFTQLMGLALGIPKEDLGFNAPSYPWITCGRNSATEEQDE